MNPNHLDFQEELENQFRVARQRGLAYLDIKSGDLHRQVGGYPGQDHRMPLCVHVMKRNMRGGDEILQQPPSGKGATVIIRYKLPR